MAMRKRRSTKKVRLSDTERLDRALHIDWIVSEGIVFRVTHCRQCGAAPGMPDRITWPQRSVFLHTLMPPYVRPSSQLKPHS